MKTKYLFLAAALLVLMTNDVFCSSESENSVQQTPVGSGLEPLMSDDCSSSKSASLTISASGTCISSTSSKKISPTKTKPSSTSTSSSSGISTSSSPEPTAIQCPKQRDKKVGIQWPLTPQNTKRRLPCPPSFTGRITRFCNKFGSWRSPDLSMCVASTIDGVNNVSITLFNGGEASMEESMFIIRQLRNLTRPPPRSSLRRFLSQMDLSIVNSVTRESLRLLRLDRNASVDVDDIFGLFSNALDSRNRESWDSLRDSEAGSEELLDNAERFAMITAARITERGQRVSFSEENLALRAERIFIDYDLKDSIFPNMDDNLVNLSIASNNNNTIRIPSQYIRAMAGNNSDISTAFMLLPTLQEFLPNADMQDNEDLSNISIASVILSAQVVSSEDADTDTSSMSSILTDDPVELIFTVYNITIDEDLEVTCVYWKFSDDLNSTVSGRWASDGVVTEIIDNMTIRCLSNHLTSFAVLVDVTGREEQNVTHPIERQVLSFISYIGCSISVACLTVTLIFFLFLGKELLVKVHFFIHLNLVISLLFGLIVFIGGINFASEYQISCKIVAAMLHFFFLSAFCWMLCEAIMMYLLVVVVFSNLATKWYLYLLLGWGLPLLIVIGTFGASFDDYVLHESNVCWLNYSNHIIWTFTAPMCVIILINIFVLIAVAVQLYRTGRKLRRMTRTSFYKNDERNRQLNGRRKSIISLMKGIIVLLPLLGITWLVGIFAINAYTQFFAWIFTILNSLQGMFIFVFHVLCSQRFQHGVRKLFKLKPKADAVSTQTRSMDSLDKV